MKILVSGGAGLIGSHTVELLARRGHTVAVVDNFSTGKCENLAEFPGDVYVCDINDMKLLDRCFNEFRPEAVLHLAAQSAISTAWENPKKDLRVNGVGTLNMLELSKKYGVRKFVFSSTSAVYQENRHSWFGMSEKWTKCNPSTPYGISKLSAEHYIRAMFPNHIILRYGNVYGERQVSIGENQLVARAFNHFMTGADFAVFGHGNQKRDFVYVGDIAYANFTALMSSHVGTYNCAIGKSYSVNEVLYEIEKLYDVVGYKWEQVGSYDPRGNVYINTSKIAQDLGWSAMTSLTEGIAKTADWKEGIMKDDIRATFDGEPAESWLRGLGTMREHNTRHILSAFAYFGCLLQ